jgi:hypothetical protein
MHAILSAFGTTVHRLDSAPLMNPSRWSRRPAPAVGWPAHHPLGDGDQGRSHEAPAHPAPQPCCSMIAATVQANAAAQHADPPRAARPTPASPSTPGGTCVGHPCRGRLARIRDAHACEPGLVGDGFIRGRLAPAVGGPQPRRVPEAARVGRQTVRQAGAILARLGEEPIAADEPPFDCLQAYCAATCDGLPRRAPDDALGVRRQAAHARVLGRPHLAMADAAHGLVDHLRHAWQDPVARRHPPLRACTGVSLQPDPPRPAWAPVC